LRSKTLSSTPSHLSSFSLYDSFDILQQGIGLSLSLDNFLGTSEFAFNNIPRSCTIAIA
jgi:hypothetical protein